MTARADVPAPLVAAVLLWLLAIFMPLAALGPDLPDALPPLAFAPSAVFSVHRGPAPADVPAYLDGYFAQLGRALDVRDTRAASLAQRDFASFLIDAAGDDAARRARAREHHLRAFLAALDAGERPPLAAVAARHGVLGEGPSSRAALLAWFDLRWEAAAARENLRGEPLSLERLLARIPREEQRAHAAWALDADCPALLGVGVGAGARVGAAQLVLCEQLRQAYIDAAATLDPGYPADEARAAARVLLGRGLTLAARRERDASRREAELARAREAFDRAREDYAALVARGNDRRFARYLLGAARALSAD